MLVLTRKIGQKVFIGNSISVTVVDIRRGNIRLGIEAPRELQISRDKSFLEKVEDIDKEVEADLKELQGDKPATF